MRLSIISHFPSAAEKAFLKNGEMSLPTSQNSLLQENEPEIFFKCRQVDKYDGQYIYSGNKSVYGKFINISYLLTIPIRSHSK